jgi:hypothetical protein
MVHESYSAVRFRDIQIRLKPEEISNVDCTTSHYAVSILWIPMVQRDVYVTDMWNSVFWSRPCPRPSESYHRSTLGIRPTPSFIPSTTPTAYRVATFTPLTANCSWHELGSLFLRFSRHFSPYTMSSPLRLSCLRTVYGGR